MRKLFLTSILALVYGISVWAQDYDFSAVCESEQILYYNVTSSTAPYTVEVSGGDNVSGNLIIPSTVTNNEITYSVVSIGDSAFNYTGLTSITSNANIPPTLGQLCFNGVTTNNITVYVPCGKKQAYQNADGWSNFTNIQIISGAEFPYTVTVAVAEDSEGFGSVEVLQQPDCEDSSFVIQANPIENYHFVSWNDGNTENPRTITVTGNAMYIATFAATTDIETSVATDISIFPNPANDIFNITSSEIISHVEFVSITGQVISSVEVNGETAVCNVEGFAPGMYFVRISGVEGSVIQRKFVKE